LACYAQEEIPDRQQIIQRETALRGLVKDFYHDTQFDGAGRMEGNIRMNQQLISTGQVVESQAEAGIPAGLEQMLYRIIACRRHGRFTGTGGRKNSKADT
jgi:hypothetical protein